MVITNGIGENEREIITKDYRRKRKIITKGVGEKEKEVKQ